MGQGARQCQTSACPEALEDAAAQAGDATRLRRIGCGTASLGGPGLAQLGTAGQLPISEEAGRERWQSGHLEIALRGKETS